MLYIHFTQEILGLQEVIVTNIETATKTLTIYAELERKSHSCIACDKVTASIYDYRKQAYKYAHDLNRF